MGDELERGQVRSVTAPAQVLQDSVPSGGVSSFSEVEADRQQLADLDTERLSVLTSRPKVEADRQQLADLDTERLSVLTSRPKVEADRQQLADLDTERLSVLTSRPKVEANRQQLADLDTERLSVLTSRPKWEVASVDTQRLVGVAPPVVPVLSPPAAARTPTIATQRQRAQAAVQQVQTSVQQAQAAVQRAQASAPWQRAQAWAIEHVRALHLVAGVAIILSVASLLYYNYLGVTLAYDDALSHMMIARRVVAGPTPGLAQLGQFWLPLTHILMLAFIWDDWLFHTGLAGSIPSMTAYIVGAVYMYRLARECFGTATAGWLAASGWMLNPNLLYMQATAMTEAPFICIAVIVIYYAVRWVKDYAPIDLVKAAAAAMAATLIRYDGWPLAAGLAVIILIVAWRRERSEGTIANGILFGFLAFSGCVGWIFYNEIFFGDAIGWYSGKYSAAYQEQHIAAQGGLPTYHNLFLSLHVYLQTVIDTVSLPLVMLAVLGILFWAFTTRLHCPPGRYIYSSCHLPSTGWRSCREAL